MKLIIAGSRGLAVTPQRIETEVMRTMARLSERDVYPDEVVSGGCATGVDPRGERWARLKGSTVTVFGADWTRHGKAAGPIRNKQMARYADAALVFCKDEPTPGSSNMATWMLALGKPVRVVLL